MKSVKVPISFWSGKLGILIKQRPNLVKLVAVYLYTNSHAHPLGIYYLPLGYLSEDLNISLSHAKESIENLCEDKICYYDFKLQWIWVCEMGNLYYDNVKNKNDNRYKQIQAALEEKPTLSFENEFYSIYGEKFMLMNIKSHISEKSTLNNKNIALSNKSIVQGVFDFWKQKMNQPDARLDAVRHESIQSALSLGYTPRQLCEAILGCTKTAYNMGYNEQGELYNGIHVIFKHAHQIDRFIHNYHNPPKLRPKSTSDANIIAISEWIKVSN